MTRIHLTHAHTEAAWTVVAFTLIGAIAGAAINVALG